jgi:hypothetical protein
VKKIVRVAQFVVLASILLYAGDYVSARFRLPHGRQTLGSVDVQIMWAIRQKDGRIDYELGDTETQPCLYSLFPHMGYAPCWYLVRHKNQVIKVGRQRGLRPDSAPFAGQVFFNPGAGTVGSLERRDPDGPAFCNYNMAILKGTHLPELLCG